MTDPRTAAIQAAYDELVEWLAYMPADVSLVERKALVEALEHLRYVLERNQQLEQALDTAMAELERQRDMVKALVERNQQLEQALAEARHAKELLGSYIGVCSEIGEPFDSDIIMAYTILKEQTEALASSVSATTEKPGLEHLQDDAPYLVCSKCGRKSWASPESLPHPCGMPQPDGSRCDGIFAAPSSSVPSSGETG